MGHDEGGGGGDEDGGKGAGRPSHISKGEVDLGRKRSVFCLSKQCPNYKHSWLFSYSQAKSGSIFSWC